MSKRSHAGTWLIIVGTLAVLTAGGLWLSNTQEEAEAEAYSTKTAEDLFDRIEQGETPSEDPEPSEAPGGSLKTIAVDEDEYIGVLTIPEYDLMLPINKTWSYPKLRRTPCRYSGDVASNTLVVAAHNYDKHFGKLSSLESGDEAYFTDVEGQVIRYLFVSRDTVAPSAVEEVVHSEYDLTLFTCTYGGETRIVTRWMRADETTAN